MKFAMNLKTVKHATNRYINRATQIIQGHNITLTTTQVQEAIKQSKIEEAYSGAGLITALQVAMSVSFCLPHPVAVSAFMICRGLCACTEMLWMWGLAVCEFWV